MNSGQLYTFIHFILWSITVSVIVWSTNKGINLQDEGFHYLSLIQPLESVWKFQYQTILNHLFSRFDFGIIEYRLLRLVLTLASSLAITLGFFKWIRSNLTRDNEQNLFGKAYAFFCISSCCLLGYAYQANSLSYNSLALVFSLLITSVLFNVLALNSNSKKNVKFKELLYLFIAGVLFALLFFTKFTSAILLGGLFVCVLLGSDGGQKVFKRLALILPILVGAGTVVLYYHFYLVPIEVWLKEFLFSVEEQSKLESYNSIGLVKKYLFNIWHSIKKGGLLVLVFVAAFKIIEFGFYKLKIKMLAYWTLFFAWISCFFAWIIINRWFLLLIDQSVERVEWGEPIIAFTTLLLCSLVMLWKRNDKQNNALEDKVREEKLVVGYLFLLPFAVAFGSSNPILVMAIPFFYSWCLLILIFTSKLISRKADLIISYVLVFAFVGLASVQTIVGQIDFPYRLPSNRVMQKYSLLGLAESRAQNLLVDRETQSLVNGISFLIEKNTNFKSGDGLIAIDNPGLCFLFEGKSPGTAWYQDRWEDLYCRVLKSPKRNLKRTIFVFKGDKRFSKVSDACFKGMGIDYKANYIEVGKKATINGKDWLYVYSPSDMLIDEREQKIKLDLMLDGNLNLDRILNIGEGFLELKEWKLAEKAYNRALEIDKNNFQVYFKLCLSLRNQNKYESAAKNCKIAELKNPGHKGVKKVLEGLNSVKNMD